MNLLPTFRIFARDQIDYIFTSTVNILSDFINLACLVTFKATTLLYHLARIDTRLSFPTLV